MGKGGMAMVKTYEELELKDDFMFSVIMRDPRYVKPFLETILRIKIAKIEYPEVQKNIDIAAGAKGIRLDVYVEDEKHTVFNLEMQTTTARNLPKRMRYYQGMIDLNILEKGDDYNHLKKSYVIFICTFDHFNMDEPVYFFRSWDVEKGLPLDDLSYTIVLNMKCSPEKVPEALKPFYEYLNDPKKNEASELTRMIDERVRKFNSSEWRKKYMTFEYILNEQKRESEAIGFEKGRSEGAALEKREIAKNLKVLGVGTAEIIKATGLSAEEVEEL